MSKQAISESFQKLATLGGDFSIEMERFQSLIDEVIRTTHGSFTQNLTVFMLACFVGYYVVWKVTPALHAPLMSVTNAISSVIIVGALLSIFSDTSSVFGYIALIAASINIFGGFIMTQRMLSMFANNNPSKRSGDHS